MRRIEFRKATLRLAAVACVLAAPAHAQLRPGLAQCAELQDGASSNIVKSCVAHTGCSMALNRKKDCATLANFVGRLKATLGGRSEITSNDVFEAYTPPITIPAVKAHVEIVRKLALDAANDRTKGAITYKPERGYVEYYEGGLKDGVRQGFGVNISESGDMARGQYENGAIRGLMQSIGAAGGIFSGTMIGDKSAGYVTFQLIGGSGMAGTSVMNQPVGIWESTEPNGVTRKDLFTADGQVIIGADAPPGQIARAPGESNVPAQAPASAPVNVGQSARAGSQADLASGSSQVASSIPGSADYQPPRRTASSTQADDPKVLGGSYRP